MNTPKLHRKYAVGSWLLRLVRFAIRFLIPISIIYAVYVDGAIMNIWVDIPLLLLIAITLDWLVICIMPKRKTPHF